jgi:hypothetical protein
VVSQGHRCPFTNSMAILLTLLNFHNDPSKRRELVAPRHKAKSPEGLNIQPHYRENVSPRIGQQIYFFSPLDRV